MIQNGKISKQNKKLIIFVYFGLMLLFYMGYILMDNYRLSNSEQWINKASLTQGDVQSIQQLGFWTSTFEFLFLGLFVIAATLMLFLYRKNIKVLAHFISIHLCLFTTIFLTGYILSFFMTAPIGNLIQPTIPSSFLLVILLLYIVIRFMKTRLSKRIKSVDT